MLLLRMLHVFDARRSSWKSQSANGLARCRLRAELTLLISLDAALEASFFSSFQHICTHQVECSLRI
jgi:hypothetical protein